MASAEKSPYELEFKPFGGDRFIPMAFGVDAGLADVEQAAETMIREGKAMWVRVFHRADARLIHSYGWQRA